MPKRIITTALVTVLVTLAASRPAASGEPAAPLRAGVIGLDAHASSWTRILNAPDAEGELAEMTVVAGFPGGSPDIPQSMELLKRGIETFKKLDVELVDSIDNLLDKVDVVLILSIDGRPHLEQVCDVYSSVTRWTSMPTSMALYSIISTRRERGTCTNPWLVRRPG